MVEISDNLKAIYIDEGLEEPKLSNKICDYCKEELLKDEYEQVLHDKDLTYTFCSDTCLKYFDQDHTGETIENLGEENEKLKKERDYYKTYSEDFAQRIEELKRELQNEKIKSEAYKNNAEVILPDAEKIKNEARQELAEAKLKLTDLEKIVKDLEKFIDGALKLEAPGSPVYCLLRGMKEVLEVEKDENL